jgi:hypothetical protein
MNAMRNIECLETAFFQISSMIITQKGLDTTLELIVRESLNCLNAHRATIFLMDEKNSLIKTQFTYASDQSYSQVELFEEKEVALKSFKENKSFLLREPKDFSELFKYGKGERKLTSLMCIPLSFQNRIIKVLSVVLIGKESSFDEKDLQLLSIFGNYAFIALEKAYWHSEVRKAVSLQKTYEQYLENIQNHLQDLIKKDHPNAEENIERLLAEKDSVGFNTYLNALSKNFNIPIISLKDFSLNSLLQKAVGEKYAENNKIVVLKNSADTIKLALAEPTKYLMDEIRRIMPPRKKIKFYLADPDEVNLSFKKHYNPFSINRFK